MIDFFTTYKKDFNNVTCHSGGAEGSDTYWEIIGDEYGVKTKAYSYKTKKHTTVNKVEISDEDYEEGVKEINKANKHLKRYGINRYMNLLARNWCQVKYSNQIFAIGTIVKSGEKNIKGYYNKSEFDVVDGGTGWAVIMAINHRKELYVYEQNIKSWFRWSYTTMSFIKMRETPIIMGDDFAGIGTRQITTDGIEAIKEVYIKSKEFRNGEIHN